MVETTRSDTLCVDPEGPVNPTGMNEPTCAWTWRMVAAPRPISSSPRGKRPPTVDRSTGPRSDCTAKVPTVAFPMETWVVTMRVIPLTLPVLLNAREEPGVGQAGDDLEAELVRVAVERRGRRQVRQAGAEDRRPAEDGNRQHRPEVRRPDGDVRTEPPSLQRVADADQCARRCPGGGEVDDHGGGTGHRPATVRAHRTGRPDRGPQAQREDHHHNGCGSDEEHLRIEGEPRRRLGQPGLTDGSQRRQGGGQEHRHQCPACSHHDVAHRAQQDQLPPSRAERPQGGVVGPLGARLPRQGLPDDRQPDQCGQQSQDEPPDRPGDGSTPPRKRRARRCSPLLQCLGDPARSPHCRSGAGPLHHAASARRTRRPSPCGAPRVVRTRAW